jgi:hypothetical protein
MIVLCSRDIFLLLSLFSHTFSMIYCCLLCFLMPGFYVIITIFVKFSISNIFRIICRTSLDISLDCIFVNDQLYTRLSSTGKYVCQDPK